MLGIGASSSRKSLGEPARSRRGQTPRQPGDGDRRPGAGSIDYTTYLRRLAALPQHPPLMLERLPNAEEYDKGRQYLIELGQRLGISVY